MAQILTAPEINPAVRQDKPNQLRQLKPPQNILMCGIDPQGKFRKTDILNNKQLTFADLAAKDKLFDTFKWNTTDTGYLKNIQIDNNFIRKAFAGITNTRFNFLAYDYIEIQILPTNNSAYYGEIAIVWNPMPEMDMYIDLFDLEIHNKPEIFTQFSNVRFEPNNSNPTIIRIPMKCLTKFILGGPTYGDAPIVTQQLNARRKFLDRIRYGNLTFYIITPLTTKSSILSLNISYSVSIIGARYSGIQG